MVELDIRASYLTILHGLTGQPFDALGRDPYETQGLRSLFLRGKDMRRWAAKQWTVATLGNSRHHGYWPDLIQKAYEKLGGEDLEADFPIKVVRQVMVEKYPILKNWKQVDLDWSRLMYAESRAVFGTMMSLAGRDISSLSVHDSLIVRKSDATDAKTLLKEHYLAVCGLVPYID